MRLGTGQQTKHPSVERTLLSQAQAAPAPQLHPGPHWQPATLDPQHPLALAQHWRGKARERGRGEWGGGRRGDGVRVRRDSRRRPSPQHITSFRHARASGPPPPRQAHLATILAPGEGQYETRGNGGDGDGGLLVALRGPGAQRAAAAKEKKKTAISQASWRHGGTIQDCPQQQQ